jgi:hypothetical protein
MSYLDVPRLNFLGRFRANATSINNYLENYDPALPESAVKPGWATEGDHAFEITESTVTSIVDRSGITHAADSGDALRGASITSFHAGKPAKMVDLDPEQRFVTQIFGLRLNLVLPSGDSGLRANMKVASLSDLWMRVIEIESSKWTGDEKGSALFQSVLTKLEWNKELPPLLEELRASVGPEDRLSIRLVLDGFGRDYGRPTAMSGRVIGTIGPYRSGEPLTFPAGRRLGFFAKFCNSGAALLDEPRRKLFIDLANALPNLSPGGAVYDDLREFLVCVGNRPRTTPERSSPAPPGYTAIGRFSLTNDLFKVRGGISEISLTRKQMSLLKSNPITLFMCEGERARFPIVWEDPAGYYVNIEPNFLRLNPGDTATCRLRATRYGQPVKDYLPDLCLVKLPSALRNNIPESALRIEVMGKTDAAGWTSTTLTATAPSGKPDSRRHIDGQVYFVGGSWQAVGQVGQVIGNGALSVLIFDEYKVKTEPDWERDILPIMARYRRLFPVMKDRVKLDLTNLTLVKENVERMINVLLPISDHEEDPEKQSAYMPVSRDLSAGKRATLINWLKSQISQSGPAHATDETI